MIITFAGTEIARETPEGGSDGILGFLPEGEQDVQVAKYLRATWAQPIARGNRTHTLAGRITRPCYVTNAAAVLDLMLKFGSLPSSGRLVFTEGTTTVTFLVAVLKGFKISERIG